jgi:hypothetical protein
VRDTCLAIVPSQLTVPGRLTNGDHLPAPVECGPMLVDPDTSTASRSVSPSTSVMPRSAAPRRSVSATADVSV